MDRYKVKNHPFLNNAIFEKIILALEYRDLVKQKLILICKWGGCN